MKLGTVVEHDMRGLCTKFEPFPVVRLFAMAVLCFSVAFTRPCPSVG